MLKRYEERPMVCGYVVSGWRGHMSQELVAYDMRSFPRSMGGLQALGIGSSHSAALARTRMDAPFLLQDLAKPALQASRPILLEDAAAALRDATWIS